MNRLNADPTRPGTGIGQTNAANERLMKEIAEEAAAERRPGRRPSLSAEEIERRAERQGRLTIPG